jgi:putative radical SAM enzyme (TIGR03279 family)
MRIVSVDPDSPLFGYIRPGYRILAVNGRKVLDSIDFRFRTAQETGTIRFADTRGRQLEVRFDGNGSGGLGLTLGDERIRRCNCDCIFCFVNQQPQGLRSSLYIKDEDYRLSFTHGNFITLSNLARRDLERIVDQRLSPLYVSVHTTDDTLRRCLLRNEKLAPILPRLKYLTGNGIILHSQVVVCPGINDGPHLQKTINDLVQLHPGVETLAVVPVGLTRYRDGLPTLRPVGSNEARQIVSFIEKHQRRFLSRLGSRFVWPADEFYVLAGRDFPRRSSYEQMAQWENGVGMARELVTVFNRRKRALKKVRSDRRVVFLTGYSACRLLHDTVAHAVRRDFGLNLSIHPVRNEFWGDMVTVSGLLVGKDLLDAAIRNRDDYDVVVLPPNCLNRDDLFLDDMSLEEFCSQLSRPVVVGRYDLVATFKDAFS